MYKAIFIDLDGTLLRKDHTVGELTKSAIRRVMSKGVPVILVSARPLDAIIPVGRMVGTMDYPIASLNGGYIVSGEKILFKSNIDLPTTAAITQEIKSITPTIIYYVDRVWFSESNNKWVEHEQKILDVQISIQPFKEIAAYLTEHQTGPNKILIMNEPTPIQAAEQLAKSLYPDLNIYTSQPTNLEVMNTDASKSRAVQLLIKEFGMDRSEIIAIGDNYNDKEMIAFAGKGIAMGNAPQEVKDAADYITDTNNADGVGKALNHFFG